MPNQTVVLVSCVGEKLPVPAAAKELYISPWFKKARHYVEQTGCPWYILSAEYGLVSPDRIISPYERTLNKMPVAARRDWATRVAAQLSEAQPQLDRAVFLAGNRYREFLIPFLVERRVSCECPMARLAIGEQLQWLGSQDRRKSDLDRLYSLLSRLQERLGAARTLAERGGQAPYPPRGVYFFFEPGEVRTDGRPRVVRVGTHGLKAGSKSSLRQRLSQHRGKVAGGGNHRGSIFRLLIGDAFKGRGLYTEAESWGIGMDTAKAALKLGMLREQIGLCEQNLEAAVSNYICSLPYLWIAIDDQSGPESNRGVIERNCIALLSNYDKTPLDPPSAQWLGNYCSRERVRQSGLWNNNHVEEKYDPAFLSLLEHYIET